MSIDDLLKQKQVTIKQRWLDLVIETYPPDSRDFFKKQKNRFSNPVGAALARQVDDLYDSLLGDPEGNEVAAKLEDFVKIRTVQDFRPSEAIGFILFLKQAVRETLAGDINTNRLFSELLALETRIDRLLLAAFDVYTKSREKLHKIRSEELKRSSFMALKRMNLEPLSHPPDDNSDGNASN